MKNTGTLVGAEIAPIDSKDLVNSTRANYVKGGVHSYPKVNDTSDPEQPFNSMYTIPEVRREWGMFCEVYGETNALLNQTYQLKRGTTSNLITDNGNWVIFTGADGGGEEAPTGNAFDYGGDFTKVPDTEFSFLFNQTGWHIGLAVWTLQTLGFTVNPAAEGKQRYDLPVFLADGTMVIRSGVETTIGAAIALPSFNPLTELPARQFILVNQFDASATNDGYKDAVIDTIGQALVYGHTIAFFHQVILQLIGTNDEEFIDRLVERSAAYGLISLQKGIDPITGDWKLIVVDDRDLAGEGGGHIIEDEGVPLAQRSTLNFVGGGVQVTDLGGKTVVTIQGQGNIDGGTAASVYTVNQINDGGSA